MIAFAGDFIIGWRAASRTSSRDSALSGSLLVTGVLGHVLVTARLLIGYCAAFALQCYSHVVQRKVGSSDCGGQV
jgi:hypothetical protein